MAKVGVVFSNLGTPSSPSPKGVGLYLGEFLMDRHVIQIPTPLRWLLVKGIIVPFRKNKSAANYQKVWTEWGSPLLVETQKAARALQQQLGDDFQVEVAMRYGNPSFAQARKHLDHCDKILFFPQYPQYAQSTTLTGLEEFYRHFSDKTTQVIEPYYDQDWFINAYTHFLQRALAPLEYDHLLMSFHGLPESHLHKTDPTGQHCLKQSECCERASAEVLRTCYRAQCVRTAQALARGLGLKETEYSMSFQSRLGRQKWIEPYTEDAYGTLYQKGVRRLAVICPGFSVDGLETLEEIALGGRESFLELGGEAFHFVPCLNDDQAWVEACAQVIKAT
jgi:protoporphyrin/coproporphyrin ferrochelatase